MVQVKSHLWKVVNRTHWSPDTTLQHILKSSVPASDDLELSFLSPSFLWLCPSGVHSCFSAFTNPEFSFPGSLLGTDHRISDWGVPYDCWVCLWNRELHGAQQLSHDYLWCALLVLCHHPLCHFCHHHCGRLTLHQAHSRCACEYPSGRPILPLSFVHAATPVLIALGSIRHLTLTWLK